MSIVSEKMYLTYGKDTQVINLYDNPSKDFYLKEGLPVNLKDGRTVYASYVDKDDLYKSHLRVSTPSGVTKYVGYMATPITQQKDVISTYGKSLSDDNATYEKYSQISFYVPYDTTIYLTSSVEMYHNAWGVSDDSWQRAYFNVYLDSYRTTLNGQSIADTSYKASVLVQRSYGSRRWRTACTRLPIKVTKGIHTLYACVYCKCSTYDSHRTEVYGWKNTISLE